jgi:2-iminobutanoate/2-iminopropanoate deaminase
LPGGQLYNYSPAASSVRCASYKKAQNGKSPKLTIAMTKSFLFASCLLICLSILSSCYNTDTSKVIADKEAKTTQPDTPEYFNLRPKLEKDYGYSHAVKIGEDLKISGAVSMNDSGIIVAPGNMEQQMKNCYSDLEKILQHYGYTYDDVIAENIYTTNMKDFIKASGFRNSIYKKQFPTGTWLEVKGLAVTGQLIEIDMEAHKIK